MFKNALRPARFLPLLLTGALFLLLVLRSGDGAAAARESVLLCGRVIVPSLLPFFILCGLLSALGLPQLLVKPAAPLMGRLFGLSGAGAAVFVIGLTGGYPMGAAAAAAMYKQGELKKTEAEKLLRFCNNSGPAFILGAAGGIFGSPKAGLLLYLAHALSAVLTGLSVCGKRSRQTSSALPVTETPSFSRAFPAAVEQAVKSTLLICGYVIFFSVLRALLESIGLFSALGGALLRFTPLTPGQTRALLTGLLEIGSGVGAMAGLSCSAGDLALCGFILGWGGLSVQFQTRALLTGSGLEHRGLMACKLLHGAIAAVLTYAMALLFL